MTVQRLVGRLQPSLGEEFAEADEAKQQEFWARREHVGAVCGKLPTLQASA